MKKILITMLLLSVFMVVSCDSGTKKDTDKDLGTLDSDVIIDDDSSVTGDDKLISDHDVQAKDDATEENDDEIDEDSDVVPDEEPDDEFIPEEYTVDGFVQKGPFIKDSEIQITELDNNFEMIPNTAFTTKTIDDLGNFNIKRKFNSRYIEIKASGFYYDEVAGAVSSTQITNYVFVDLKANNSKISINILTTLARKRIQYLMKNGKNFNEARSQSETEILEIFGIFGEPAANFQDMDILKAGNSNAMLLAISARLQGGNTPGAMSSLAAGIIYDIEQDGKLDDDFSKTKISEGGIYISSKLTDIRNNLDTYFGSKTTVEVPNFEDYCDDDGNGIINKWEFDLDFATKEKAERDTAYVSEAKQIKINPALTTVATARTDAGIFVINGTDTEISEITVVNGDTVAVKLTSSDQYKESITANVVIEMVESGGKTGNWNVAGTYTVNTVECDGNDTRTVPCGYNNRGVQNQSCIERVWTDTAVCDDPDECKDNNTSSEECGPSGLQALKCITGKWEKDGDCTCSVPESIRYLSCGSGGTGSQKQSCISSVWQNTGNCTREFNCPEKPANSVWNTVDKYTQTWNGTEWLPADSTTVYNLNASTTSCVYKCNGTTFPIGFPIGNQCGCNMHAGKCWSDRKYHMEWNNAIAYCQALGGWLPTINELRTLIKDCPATQTYGTCNVTDSCLYSSCRNTPPCNGCTYDGPGKYSVFGDTDILWSSSSDVDDTSKAWRVNFDFGDVVNIGKTNSFTARCVR